MPRRIAADAFLDALDLPSEHPYAEADDNGPKEKERWSVASYFNSWQDSARSAPIEGSDECETSPSPWAKTECRPRLDADADRSTLDGSNEVGLVPFFLEIRPCLVAMCHMNVLLWAPVVILCCLKRLYAPKRAPPPSSRETRQRGEALSCFVPPSSCAPSLRGATRLDEEGKRAPEYHGSASFARLLLSLSLLPNAITAMAGFAAVFSVEEKKKDVDDEPAHHLRADASSDQVRNHPGSESLLGAAAPFQFTAEWAALVVALVFTAVVMNDAMYALAFPQSNLVALHLFMIYLSLKMFATRVALATALPISAIAFCIMANRDLDLPTIVPGLYFDETNPFISEVVSRWPIERRAYDRGTPWMLTGDVRTGLPFMLNSVPEINYARRWVPLPEEKEAVILDIAFPDSNAIDNDKKVYLVLHGINGDSNEGYVVDFVHRQVSQGNVVAVMVTRGLGDSAIVGDSILHFARTSDVAAAAGHLKRAIDRVSPNDGLLLVGTGYSMGATTLANYVAASGRNCDLDVAIAFSGALDTTQQVDFRRSAHLWQPFIAKAMRDTLLSRYSGKIGQKLGQQQLKEVMMARSLVELDESLFVPYFGFESLNEYYREMGALGDFEINAYAGRISRVAVPLLCVQSLDDPIGTWKSFHGPEMVAKSGNGNTVLLFTETGGHVGWPLGWNPALHGWRWMSDVASSFAESVDQARRIHTHTV